jgi:hypothetical protein
MADAQGKGQYSQRLNFLSTPHTEWMKVAAKQEAADKITKKAFKLPVEEFRKIPYKPPPVPSYAPVPGKDINIAETKVRVRDGVEIGIRIYRPLSKNPQKILFLNVHGGGILVTLHKASYPKLCLETNSNIIRMDSGKYGNGRDSKSTHLYQK